jgi:hypothetical protein
LYGDTQCGTDVAAQVLEKSVTQMKDLKLRLLKSAAAEACMQVTNSTYARHVRAEVVRDLQPQEILSSSQIEKLSASYTSAPSSYHPAGGW